MLDREAAQSLCEQALRMSQADGCEVALGGGLDTLTRFANNEIHQNMASESYELSVRSIIGRRTGRASTTRLDPEGLRRVVAESERVTRVMPECEELLPLLEPQEYATVPAADDEETARLGAEERAEMARRMIEQAEKNSLLAAGLVRTVVGAVGEYGEKGTIALANSKGLFAYHRPTWLKLTLTVMSPESSGWADAESHRAVDLDPDEVGRIACEKALRSRAPRSIPAGEYDVILEPAAVAEMVAFLIPEFSATLVDEGRSFLSNRQETQIFGSNIDLRADPYHPLHAGTPFDEEGLPVRPVTLVAGGMHRGLVYDRLAARRHAVEPTGHALRVPSTEGAMANCLVLQGGATSLDEMIRSTQRGLLVTRFWYTRPVDPVELLITGMTRDGTFLVEEGEVRTGIKNFRFNQSILDMFRNVTALGPQVYSWPAVVPPLKVRGFRFTSETSF